MPPEPETIILNPQCGQETVSFQQATRRRTFSSGYHIDLSDGERILLPANFVYEEFDNSRGNQLQAKVFFKAGQLITVS